MKSFLVLILLCVISPVKAINWQSVSAANKNNWPLVDSHLEAIAEKVVKDEIHDHNDIDFCSVIILENKTCNVKAYFNLTRISDGWIADQENHYLKVNFARIPLFLALSDAGCDISTLTEAFKAKEDSVLVNLAGHYWQNKMGNAFRYIAKSGVYLSDTISAIELDGLVIGFNKKPWRIEELIPKVFTSVQIAMFTQGIANSGVMLYPRRNNSEKIRFNNQISSPASISALKEAMCYKDTNIGTDVYGFTSVGSYDYWPQMSLFTGFNENYTVTVFVTDNKDAPRSIALRIFSHLQNPSHFVGFRTRVFHVSEK